MFILLRFTYTHARDILYYSFKNIKNISFRQLFLRSICHRRTKTLKKFSNKFSTG